MTPTATVAAVRAGFAPTLVCASTILANGPTDEDLTRLASDLGEFADDLVEAAEANGETLPEPLVSALEAAFNSVAFAFQSAPQTN